MGPKSLFVHREPLLTRNILSNERNILATTSSSETLIITIYGQDSPIFT